MRGSHGRLALGLIAGSLGLVGVAVADDDAAGPIGFVESASARGIDYEVPTWLFQEFAYGRAASFADLDSDGDPDVVTLGASDWRVGIFENDGAGFFTDATSASGIAPIEQASGLSFADYDGDGDLDIYVTVWTQADRLLRNDGELTFTDVTSSVGLGDTGAGGGSAWGDVNGDGWLDLFVANRTGTYRVDLSGFATEPDRLYLNQEGESFLEVGGAWGVADTGMGFHGTFFDADRDGDLDLFLAADKGDGCAIIGKDRLYLNMDQAGFVDHSTTSGITTCMDSMCAAVGDFNSDPWLDVYVTNIPVGNALYVNDGTGAFEDLAATYDATIHHTGWGAVFLDCDQDGNNELFICSEDQPNNLLEYNGARIPLTDLAPSLGVDAVGPSYTVSCADVDGDGDRDLLVAGYAGSNTLLYINGASQGRNWIDVEALGPYPNTHGVGAIVEIMIEGEWRAQQVHAGNGYKAQHQFSRHWGLGDSDSIDAVRVTWPGGAQRTLLEVDANLKYTLRWCAADLDNNGELTTADFQAFSRAYSRGVLREADFTDAAAPTPLQPRFGVPDGAVTPADFAAFALSYASGCP